MDGIPLLTAKTDFFNYTVSPDGRKIALLGFNYTLHVLDSGISNKEHKGSDSNNNNNNHKMNTRNSTYNHSAMATNDIESTVESHIDSPLITVATKAIGFFWSPNSRYLLIISIAG